MLRVTLITLTVLFGAWAAHADNPQTTSLPVKKGASASPAQETSANQKIKGHVKKVDASKHTIKIRVGEKTKTFRYSEKTSFVKDDQHVDPSTIKKGDRVSIAFDSNNVAHKVKVESDSTSSE